MYAIELEHLRKTYGFLEVLRGVSLQVPLHESYGLLGVAGVGKSTLIHLLLGFLKPTGGRVRLLGTSNLESARVRVGYMPDRLAYHRRTTARSYLQMLGQMHALPGRTLRRHIDDLLGYVGLQSAADYRLSELSNGLLQRVGLAQALLANPDLLLLDDPLHGLDMPEQADLLALLGQLRSHGLTLFCCAHYHPGLLNLCDRVGVLGNGLLLAETTSQALRTNNIDVRIQVHGLLPELRERLTTLTSAITCTAQTITLQPNSPQLQQTVLQTLTNEGVLILTLEPLAHPLGQFYADTLQRALHQPPPASSPAQSPDPATALHPPPAPPSAQPSAPPPDELLNQLLSDDQPAPPLPPYRSPER